VFVLPLLLRTYASQVLFPWHIFPPIRRRFRGH
jgi:hypothetical protein